MSFKSFSGSIVAGQTTSNAILLNEFWPWGIITGSNITSSTLGFLGSADNVTYVPVYNKDSTEVTITATSGSYRGYVLDPVSFAPYNYIKVREGTAASAVVQQTVNTLFTITARS